MNDYIKSIDALQVIDLQAFPIWEYSSDAGGDEVCVSPVKQLPVKDLNGKIIGDRITLANGSAVWAILGNLSSMNSRSNEHFLTLTVLLKGRSFGLARYHDFDYEERGPDALAQFLDLPVDSVFPISYDVSRFVKGNEIALRGRILREPKEQLTQSELIALSIANL